MAFDGKSLPFFQKVLLKNDFFFFLFVAGVDTVGNSLLYTLWLISLDQRVQSKLRQELLSIVTNLGPDNLQNLPYLKACVKESFRMYPTASQIARLTEKSTTTLKNGIELPCNSVVLCHTHVASRLEENFTEANKYHPGKFLNLKMHKNEEFGTTIV